MPKATQKSVHNAHETQNVDKTFGQSKAFAVVGPYVNPEVVAYLNTVRQEALRTSAIGVIQKTERKGGAGDSGSLYDEDPVLHSQFIRFNNCQGEWLSWFRQLKIKIGTEGYKSTGYDAHSLNLLISCFKQYLEGKEADNDSTVASLLQVLKDVPPPSEDKALVIDEEWADNLTRQMTCKNAKLPQDVEDLKKVIIKPEQLPRNFNAWYYYVTNNDPSYSVFERLSPAQIIKLASYMGQWIGDIIKSKNEIRVSHWLLYVLLYLPDRLPAQEISILRDLGKKARTLKMKSVETGDLIPDLQIPLEMEEAFKPSYPFTVIDLSLVIVGLMYGQKDLLEWI